MQITGEILKMVIYIRIEKRVLEGTGKNVYKNCGDVVAHEIAETTTPGSNPTYYIAVKNVSSEKSVFRGGKHSNCDRLFTF